MKAISMFIILLLMCLTVFLLYRNMAVSKFRDNLIDRIYELNKKDIERGKGHQGYQWRWKVYESVSYERMLYEFWKPLESFYKDKSFLKEE